VQMAMVTTRPLPDSATLVELAGEIDLANAGELGVRLQQEMDGGRGRMVIRMADVRFLDSAGLEMLRVLRQRAIARGTAVVLAQPSAQVRRLLSLCGSVDEFPVVDDGRPLAS
jgi:anti-sigma B factor antagonist